MFCFEHVMFETCKPILVVYIAFVFCILLIAIVLILCLCSSGNDDKKYLENATEIETPSVVYIHRLEDEKKDLVEGKASSEYSDNHPQLKLASEILLQQLEIYQMANYNRIEPVHRIRPCHDIDIP